MHDNSDEQRLSSAEQLAGHGGHAAAQACLAIATDDGVSDEVRFSAAELLSSLTRTQVR